MRKGRGAGKLLILSYIDIDECANPTISKCNKSLNIACNNTIGSHNCYMCPDHSHLINDTFCQGIEQRVGEGSGGK